MMNRTTQLAHRCKCLTSSGFLPGFPGAINGND
jgi:hypothetical protein